MAQDATTVTPPNPTPPTNISYTGASGPNPGTFDPTIYHNGAASSAGNVPTAADVHYPRPALAPYFDDGITRTTTSGGYNENIPPSGVSASPQAFAAKTAALLVAGTSADHEGLGAVTVVTATVPNPGPGGQLKWVGSVGVDATAATRAAGPNQSHPATLSPATFPALSSLTPTTAVSALTGTQLITLTGTSFVPGCRIWVDNVERVPTYVSATSLTTTIPKKPNAGAVLVKVGLGGGFTAPQTFTWT